MKKRSYRQRTLDTKRRQQTITRWLSSFVVTIVVVTTVVAARIAPVVAEFITARAIGTEIFYRVLVTDPNETLTENEIQLVITSPLEEYVLPVPLGQTAGTHTMSYFQSTYTLRIEASQGFGFATLAETSVQASSELVGAISQHELDESLNVTQHPYALRYRIRTLFADPNHEAVAFYLQYGMLGFSELISDPDAEPLTYESIAVEVSGADIWIEDIPNQNGIVFLRFLAINNVQETVILDQLSFGTPLQIDASFYVVDVGSKDFLVSLYWLPLLQAPVRYTLELWQEQHKLESRNFDVAPLVEAIDQEQESFHEMEKLVYFDDLLVSTSYQLRLLATYRDPYSLTTQTAVVSEENITTTALFSYHLEYERTTTTLEITLTITDPMRVIQQPQVYFYQMVEGYDLYLASFDLETLSELNEPRQYHGSFAFPLEEGVQWRIVVNKNVGTRTYYWCELDVSLR